MSVSHIKYGSIEMMIPSFAVIVKTNKKKMLWSFFKKLGQKWWHIPVIPGNGKLGTRGRRMQRA